MEKEVSFSRTSPVPSSFAIPSPMFVPSLELYSNCRGGVNESLGDSITNALPAGRPLPASIIIYPSKVSSLSKTILSPFASTISFPCSMELFIPTVLTL